MMNLFWLELLNCFFQRLILFLCFSNCTSIFSNERQVSIFIYLLLSKILTNIKNISYLVSEPASAVSLLNVDYFLLTNQLRPFPGEQDNLTLCWPASWNIPGLRLINALKCHVSTHFYEGQMPSFWNVCTIKIKFFVLNITIEKKVKLNCHAFYITLFSYKNNVYFKLRNIWRKQNLSTYVLYNHTMHYEQS